METIEFRLNDKPVSIAVDPDGHCYGFFVRTWV